MRFRASLRRTSDLTSAVVKYVFLSVAYTEAGAGYQISIRSCHEKLHADKIAAYICDGVGGTGEVEVTQYESLNYHVLVEKEKGGYNSIWKEKKEGCSCSERHFLSYCSWIA